jgi:hypothetical protein
VLAFARATIEGRRQIFSKLNHDRAGCFGDIIQVFFIHTKILILLVFDIYGRS